MLLYSFVTEINCSIWYVRPTMSLEDYKYAHTELNVYTYSMFVVQLLSMQGF